MKWTARLLHSIGWIFVLKDRPGWHAILACALIGGGLEILMGEIAAEKRV